MGEEKEEVGCLHGNDTLEAGVVVDMEMSNGL